MPEYRWGLTYRQAEQLRAANPGKYRYVRSYLRRGNSWVQSTNTYGLQTADNHLLGNTLVINLTPEESAAIEALISETSPESAGRDS